MLVVRGFNLLDFETWPLKHSNELKLLCVLQTSRRTHMMPFLGLDPLVGFTVPCGEGWHVHQASIERSDGCHISCTIRDTL